MRVPLEHLHAPVSSHARNFHYCQIFFEEPRGRLMSEIVPPEVVSPDLRAHNFPYADDCIRGRFQNRAVWIDAMRLPVHRLKLSQYRQRLRRHGNDSGNALVFFGSLRCRQCNPQLWEIDPLPTQSEKRPLAEASFDRKIECVDRVGIPALA